MEEHIHDEVFKIYKEHSYANSKGEPFGISIKGKAKDYILAHKNLRQLFKKGKLYNVKYKPSPKESKKSGKMKFLSISEINMIFDMFVEVTLENGERGLVLSEIGWLLPHFRARRSMVRQFHRLINMDENRLTKKIFMWDKQLSENPRNPRGIMS